VGIRKVPKPFSRPSATISSPDGSKKEWKDVPAEKVKAGDIVTGVGLVSGVFIHKDQVRIEGGANNIETFFIGQPVKAFTEA